MTRRAIAPIAFVLLACTGQPPPTDGGTKVETRAAPQPKPEPDDPKPIAPTRFEIGPGPDAEPLSAAVIDAPIPTEPPQLEFWTKGDAACEPGGKLSGAAPPDGTEIRCVDAEGRWTGMEARFHDNGKLQSIGRKHENHMVGVWQWFHPSGAKAAEHTYVDGRLHGTVRRWAENGQEIEYGEYRGGRAWGLFIQRDETGKELGRAQLVEGTGVLVNASINRRTESDYVHGLMHGTHRVFDGEGRKLEESLWSGGEMHGLQTRWDADGRKVFEGQWKLGKQHGEFTRILAGQLADRSIWIEGDEIARQLYQGNMPLAKLPPATDCDTDAGLSKYLEGARDRGCMGADFVIDCKLVSAAPSSADLLARAGWANANDEHRIELAQEYVREFALANDGNVTNDPDDPQWKALDDGGVEGVVWVAEPAGMRRGVDKDKIRFTFAADGSLKREVLQHLSARDDD